MDASYCSIRIITIFKSDSVIQIKIGNSKRVGVISVQSVYPSVPLPCRFPFLSTQVSIPFHIYIHDLFLDEPIGTLTSWVNTYTSDIGKLVRFMVFCYFFWLKQIPIHQLTPNLCFNIVASGCALFRALRHIQVVYTGPYLLIPSII